MVFPCCMSQGEYGMSLGTCVQLMFVLCQVSLIGIWSNLGAIGVNVGWAGLGGGKRL